MACTTIQSIPKGCANNIGGIYAMYVIDMDSITSITESAVDWEVSAIVKTEAFVPVEFNRYTGNYVEDQQNSNENGSQVVTQTLSPILHRREAAKSRALHILGEGNRYLGIVVKDGNGRYWFFPDMQLQSVGEGSGTAKADGSKYSPVFVAMNEHLAYEVDPAIVPGLLTV